MMIALRRAGACVAMLAIGAVMAAAQSPGQKVYVVYDANGVQVGDVIGMVDYPIVAIQVKGEVVALTVGAESHPHYWWFLHVR